ncbi:uncharacterized protein LOC113238056 [Hyposmocoma kahamanoa]|uniref:uncharacterized protein LOC113238056 n=1 Tax=Hyposmocoma kahamanoa TaxID=1477025 RepID=UPI000E6D6FE8|nr:uncharacterized protein LOC113238056 [Hyposmocoma kahamanoa]
MDSLEAMSASEETRRLRADNKRMQGQLSALKTEVIALRKAFSERPWQPPPGNRPVETQEVPQAVLDLMEDQHRSLLVTLGEMVNVRLGEMEKRLPPAPVVRPPLAADRRLVADTPSMSDPRVEPSPSQCSKKKKKKHSPAAKAPAKPASTATTAQQLQHGAAAMQSAARTAHAAAPSSVTEWTEVVRRKPKKKPSSPPAAPAPRVNRKSKAKITTPKSTAVVITLKPEAVKENVSYKDALGRATATLELGTVGLDFVRVRSTATGARIIEVPGADSGKTADALAEKLEGIIGDVATITRPVKTADLRITGLDESVDAERVQRAVATKGGCTLDQVKVVGNIRTGPYKTGSVLVRCPVATAKVLIAARRLLVGWSSAQVRALDPLPMRCFRCLGTGHSRALCPSPIDRSNLCFRCGKEGHKSATCNAEPRCAVCIHARRPAGHVMGGRACAPPPTRGKMAFQVRATEPAEGEMET